MRKFFDAVADAHFVPQDDGSVRFALPKPNAGYLMLDAAQAEGAKIFWKPLVRYHVYACHASIPLSLIVPWLGLVLLPTLWLIAYCLIQEIRQRYNPEVGQDVSQHDWVNYQLSQLISQRQALWLRRSAWLVLLLVVFTPMFFGIDFEFYEMALVCLLIVAVRWSVFFGALSSSPMAKENWAQAGRAQHAVEAKTE